MALVLVAVGVVVDLQFPYPTDVSHPQRRRFAVPPPNSRLIVHTCGFPEIATRSRPDRMGSRLIHLERSAPPVVAVQVTHGFGGQCLVGKFDEPEAG